MNSDLRGLTIAVTGSRRATELARLIQGRGGSPYMAPTVGIESSESLGSEVERFCQILSEEKVDYAVFMTGPGVFGLFEGARRLGKEKEVAEMLSTTCVVARSAKPRDALSKHGVRVNLVPDEATSEGLLELLGGRVASKSVAVLSHGSNSARLCEGLKEAGAMVSEFSTYTYSLQTDGSGARILDSMQFSPVLPQKSRMLELIEATISGKLDAITFTSPPSARNLFSVASEIDRLDGLLAALNTTVIVAAVGPPTRDAVEEAGAKVDVVPSVYKMGPMINELCNYIKAHGPKGKARTRERPPDGC